MTIGVEEMVAITKLRTVSKKKRYMRLRLTCKREEDEWDVARVSVTCLVSRQVEAQFRDSHRDTNCIAPSASSAQDYRPAGPLALMALSQFYYLL